MTLIGKPTLPANNYAELVKWMEANKGKINLANAGLGAASHLCGLLLQSTLKIDMQTVPYKGTAPAMNDLLGGQVDLMCDQTTNTTGQIEAGKVKAFAVTSSKRADDAGAEEPADARRGRAEGIQRHHLARRSMRRRARRRRSSTSSTRRCARRSRIPTSSSAKRRSAR